jgi:hypothetical protein
MMIGYNCSFFVLLILLLLTFFDIIITEIIAFVPSTPSLSSSASLSLSLSARRRPKTTTISTRSCCFIIPVHNRITATTSTTTTTTTTTTILYGVTGSEDATNESSNNNDDDGDSTGDGNRQSSFDVENARQRLENLLDIETENYNIESNNDDDDKNTAKKRTTTTAATGTSTTMTFSFSELLSAYSKDGIDFSLSALPKPPPLSTIERDRRKVEIKLLKSLDVGDEGLGFLWDHWYSERGIKAKSLLKETDDMFTDPTSWVQCEQNLIQLIDEYGIYFVEPVNRLATLYFLQGKLPVSYRLCQLILSIKPYHIGALSGIVQVCIHLRDPNEAREWAKKRLPSLGAGDQQQQQLESPRRIEWVEWAVVTAKERLDEAERRTQEDFFGSPDTNYDNRNKNNSDGNNNNNSINNNETLDAWQ